MLSEEATKHPPPDLFRQDFLMVGLLTVPFLLNDFANIFVNDYRLWLAIDYVCVKALPIILLLAFLKRGWMTFSDLGIQRIPLRQFVAWTFNMTVLGIFLDQVGGRVLARLLPETRLGGIPVITNPVADRIDLYFGLALVASIEEVIFRGLYLTVLPRWFRNQLGVFAISALVFGAIHWSLGLSAIVQTAILGVVFMICVQKTGSVLPTIVAHFFVNYVAFSGLLFPARF